MYKLPEAPSSLGGILDDGFKLFRASWKQLLPLAIVASLISVVPQIIVAGLMSIRPGQVPSFATLGAGVVATIVVIALLSLIAYVVVLAGVHLAARSEALSTGAALRAGLRRVPPYLVFMLFGMLVGVVFAMLFGVLSFARVALIIGLIVLLLYLSIALYPAYLLPVVEELGPIASLSRAWRLVRGAWWRTAGILTIVGLIIIALAAAASFIGELVQGPAAIMGNPTMKVIIAVNLIVALLTAPLVPLMYCLLYAVYTDLRLRKDGGDLLSRATAAGA